MLFRLFKVGVSLKDVLCYLYLVFFQCVYMMHFWYSSMLFFSPLVFLRIYFGVGGLYLSVHHCEQGVWPDRYSIIGLWFFFQQCAGSICEKYGLEECTCASSDGKDDKELCHVCCMKKSKAFKIQEYKICFKTLFSPKF